MNIENLRNTETLMNIDDLMNTETLMNIENIIKLETITDTDNFTNMETLTETLIDKKKLKYTETSIHTDDTIINMPRKTYEKLLFEREAQIKACDEIKTNVVLKFNKLKETKENEIEKLNQYILEIENKEHGEYKKKLDFDLATQSIFQTKSESIFSKHSDNTKDIIDNTKHISGGFRYLSEIEQTEKSDKNISINKRDTSEKVIKNDNISKHSNSLFSGSNLKTYMIEDVNTTSIYSNSETYITEDVNTTSYSNSSSNDDVKIYTKDKKSLIYTEDEINSAYESMEREMDYLNKKMNNCLKGGDLDSTYIKRIKFILKSLRILDKLKKTKM
jgi:hypothetical protein